MSLPPTDLLQNYEHNLHNARGLAASYICHQWKLATAESCTGGLIAACCTDIAGSSDWFERGFVTYSNAAKTEMLWGGRRPDQPPRRSANPWWCAPWRKVRCNICRPGGGGSRPA